MDDMIYETLAASEDVTYGAVTARKNPFCVVSKATFGQYGVRDIQVNSGWVENPYGEDYAVVPDDMVPLIRATGGYCDLEFSEDGTVVTSFMALPVPEPIEPVRAAKEAEISASCNAAIVAGMDVETSVGTEHFSLEETDQINLTTAVGAIQGGATSYPYHADGQLCRLYAAEEILAIGQAATNHKLYHTTLCNHLLTWARRAETVEEIKSISYSAEGLPEDLAASMAELFTATAALEV